MATTAPTEAPLVPLADYEETTLVKLFRHPIREYDLADAMLFRGDSDWIPISHAEIADRVEKLAAGLNELGIGKGSRVAILSENRPEWAISDFAVLSLGAADVPVYATLPPNQIAHILRNSESRAILVSNREQLDKILEIRGDLPALSSIIVFDEPGDAADVLTLDQVMERGGKRIASGSFPSFDERAADVDPEDLATLIYTSGTTGDPKGVMLTHRNIAANVAACDQQKVFSLEPGKIGLSFLPLSHSFERVIDYLFWSRGTTIAYVASPDLIAQSMIEVKPHVMAAAPRIFEKIYTRVMGATGLRGRLINWARKIGEGSLEERLKNPGAPPTRFFDKLADRLVFSKLRERTGGRVQGFVSGSAPLSPEINKFFWAAGMPIYEGYGLTESSPVLSVNHPGRIKLGTVGPPIPGTEIRIAPSGEILARGPQVMQGYYQNPEATDEMIDADDWLHTGDIGEIDAEGFIRITDRLKNIIVTAGGKNVAPAPIEQAAALSPFVEQAVMIGDRRPFPSLLVVPDFENLKGWAAQNGISETDPEELARNPRVHDFLEKETIGSLDGFARYEMPKKIGVIPREMTVETGELTPSLKVKRRIVEEKYRDLIEEIYDV